MNRNRFLHSLLIACFACAVWTQSLSAAAPLVGTSIGNQAKATYTDNSNVEREVFSNTVITRVTQIYALDLGQNNTRIATPGSQVYFPHTVTNLGNGPDTIELLAETAGSVALMSLDIYPDSNQDGLPDNFNGINTTGQLAAGAKFHFVVVGIVPPSATAPDTGGVTVTANSIDIANTPTATDTNNDTFTVTSDAVLQVNKSINVSSGEPGTSITYTLTYTNTGNSPAIDFTLTDAIPTGMSYTPDSARWSVTPTTVLTDEDNGDSQNGITYDYNVTKTDEVTFVLAQVNPGQSGWVTFEVAVNSGIPPQVIPNTAHYKFETGDAQSEEFASNTVPFTVIQVPGVELNAPDPEESADAGDTVTWINTLTNTGTGIDTFDITLDTSGIAPAEQFPTGTTFQLFQADGNTPMTDSNGNGIPDTGPVDPGASYNVVLKAILPGNIPNESGPFKVRKLARSTFDPDNTTDSAIDELTLVNGASVDLTANAALPDAPGEGIYLTPGASDPVIVENHANPGTITTFTLVVNNTGPDPDSYDLLGFTQGLAEAPTGMLSGWTVVFKSGGTVISNTGVISSGGNRTLTAEVFVPADAVPADASNIFFRIQSPVTGAKDYLKNHVNVNTIRSVSLQSDNVGQTFPGGSVVYEHLLTNNGNVTEGDNTDSIIKLELDDSLVGAGFTSVVYYDLNNDGSLDSTDPVVVDNLHAEAVKPAGLKPGEQVRLFVKVFAPLGAPDNATNVTTLTATTSGGVNAPPAVKNHDTTSIIRGDLIIVKRQRIDDGGTPGAVPGDSASGFAAVDGAGNGELDGGESGFQTTRLSAPPRSIIVYEITVTNVGSADATGITVNDTVPANTVYFARGSQGIANVDGDTSAEAVPTAPADLSTGSFVFNVGTLAPTETATLTFAVKINE